MNPQPELGGSRAMLTADGANGSSSPSAISSPQNNFLVGRLGYCANCNLLDAVPKVDGFFSLTPRENDDVLSLFYTRTNADFPGLEDFMGVSQISAPDQIYHWQSRTNFLPLVTAGQKPVFLDDDNALRALTQTDFDGGKIVFLPPEEKPFVHRFTNQTSAKILNSKFGNRTVDVEVEAAEPSLVVVAQTYYHNWRARLDGSNGRQPLLLRANLAFQAVEIPAGTASNPFVTTKTARLKSARRFCILSRGWAALDLPASIAGERKLFCKNFRNFFSTKRLPNPKICTANGENQTHRHSDGGRRQSRTKRGDPRRRENRARLLRHGNRRLPRRLSRPG